jgi:LmbE family N-acetylglucosaminyl deacetylase
MTKRVLVLVAHPDDAEFFAGGTIARFVEEGAQVRYVIAADGQRGTFAHASEALAALRKEEALRAAAAMGAQPPLMLGFPDLELDKIAPGVLREKFIRAVREERPDILIAEDPFALGEPHPDHRAVAIAAVEAVSFAMLPLMHPEHLREGLQPHFVAEKYYYAESGGAANKVVDITATMEKKLSALAEHKTQMEFLVEEVGRQAELAGLDLGALLGAAAADPMLAVGWAMRSQAAEVGRPAGFEYGEAFRYARFHPFVEGLLAGQGAVPGA